MRVVLAACILLLSAARAVLAAESTTGTLTGSVSGTTGAAVSGARVFAVSPSGRYAAITDARGRFFLWGLAADTYVISVQANGFVAASRSGIVILPGQTQAIAFQLAPDIKTIAKTRARAPAISVGDVSDVFTVTSGAARAAAPPVSSSGLSNYAAGTVQGAIASVPGVVLDPFANAILRGGKVADAVFDFDSVPIPQGLIAEPGGNVVGAQLPTTGIASTTVTLAGYESQGDNALGGVIDQIPAVGTYPGTATVELSSGVAGPRAQHAYVQILAATPDQRWRYAFAGSADSQGFAYGDGRTFYPAEAATYGLALSSRAQTAFETNVHYRPSQRDDLSLLAFTGQASYDQYATPYAGETFGAFDGATITYPGETNPDAPVQFATGTRGSFGVLKAAWLRTGARSLSRIQMYRSQFNASAAGPYWDENGFPDGTFSFSGRQSGTDAALLYDGEDVYGESHHLRYGAQYRITTYTLRQVVPTFDEIVHSNPTLFAYLAYIGDTWTVSPKLGLMGALRLTGTRIVPSTGFAYGVAALDPHAAAVYHAGARYALRATFDRTTVPPAPLEADRYDSTNVDQNGRPAPFVALAPETADTYTLAFEGSGKTQFRATLWAQSENNRIDVLPYNYRRTVGGEVQPSPIGVPTNAGRLSAEGVELWMKRGGVTLDTDYLRALSSSASQFAYNNLNAPAIAAGHLFPVGYVPDFTATLSYEITAGARMRIEPSLSYESGYPYGVGRAAWIFDPVTHRPKQVPNDNFVNPGAGYFFLRDPSHPYDPASNPYIGSLGTPEGNDPNTLRSPPQTLVNLHIEGDVTPQVTAIVDIANVFGNFAPTEYQSNPYLIGPPGYAGGDALYAAYYQHAIGTAQPYVLGNGVPTNNGVTQAVPWTYGRAGYVPQSYPMGRTVELRLRYRI